MKRLLDSYLFSFFDTLITLVKLYLNLLVKRRDLQRYRSFMLSFLSRNGFTTNRKGFFTIGSCLILYIKIHSKCIVKMRKCAFGFALKKFFQYACSARMNTGIGNAKYFMPFLICSRLYVGFIRTLKKLNNYLYYT